MGIINYCSVLPVISFTKGAGGGGGQLALPPESAFVGGATEATLDLSS